MGGARWWGMRTIRAGSSFWRVEVRRQSSFGVMAQPNTFYDIEDYFSEEDSLQGSQLPPRSPDPPGDSDVGDSQLSNDPNNPEWYYTEGIVPPRKKSRRDQYHASQTQAEKNSDTLNAGTSDNHASDDPSAHATISEMSVLLKKLYKKVEDNERVLKDLQNKRYTCMAIIIYTGRQWLLLLLLVTYHRVIHLVDLRDLQSLRNIQFL